MINNNGKKINKNEYNIISLVFTSIVSTHTDLVKKN